jgi:hypothetical protein
VAFEEISLLRELDRAIDAGELPTDLLVLYKPHPLRFARANEKSFDSRDFKHVVQVLDGRRKLTELDVYPDLLAASDALISPFSTMVIEGARFGLPALCLGYNDPGHANHDWGRAAFNLHTYVMRHGDWAIVCENRTHFMARCREMITMIGDPEVASAARAAAEMVWRTGRTSVAERIATAARTVAAGRDADNSLAMSNDSPSWQADLAMEAALLSKD